MLDIEKLIREVYVRRSIWDQKHPSHHSRDTVHKLWKEIASNCDTTTLAAKTKWKSLRDCFRTEYKKQVKAKSNGNSEEAPPSTWLWYKDLLFLKGQIGTKRKVRNLPQTIEEVEEDIVEAKFDIHYEDLKTEGAAESTQESTSSPDLLRAAKINETNSLNRNATPEIYNSGDGTSSPVSNLSLASANRSSRSRVNMTTRLDYGRKPQIPLALFNPQDFHFNTLGDDDSYYFLMSLHRPLSSLPAERAMFIRYKIQELIYNEIFRINQ